MPSANDRSTNQAYQALAKKHQPQKPVVSNLLRAFVLGGLICLLGQVVLDFFTAHGFSAIEAPSPTAVVMIGVGSLLTGLGWYDSLVTWGGMGGSLPITGFANSIVAPAMEFKREGLVMGVGARMFTVAGPVLAYGMGAAFLMGLARMLFGIGA